MKTVKALKITSIFQIIYCLYCFVPVLFFVIGDNTGVRIYTELGIFLFGFTIINPTVITSFCVNISKFLSERNDPVQKKIIGLKWIWIVVWPLITTIFFIFSGLILIKYTGGV